MIIRPPQAAGKLYPSDADDLVSYLAQLLLSFPATKDYPSALVVPHEPFEDAGVVAAAAFRHLTLKANKINQVMIIGAASENVNGVVLPVCDQFRTPLGAVAVNQQQVDSLSLLPFVHRNEREHFSSNTIEIQLPYLQTCLIDFQILPMLIGNISSSDLRLMYESLPDSADSLLILSVDILGHSQHCSNQREQFIFDTFVDFIENKELNIFGTGHRELPLSLGMQIKEASYQSFVIN